MKNKLFIFALIIFTFACKKEHSSKSIELSVGDIQTIYNINYLNDHSIIFNNKDRKWHLFGIIYPQTNFIHLTADSLLQTQWHREEKDFTDNNREIWAPHIIEHDDLFYMFYTKIGTPRQICYATSKDLYNWQYHKEPILALQNKSSNNLKNKDPMVFRDKENNQWIMYYSMMKDDKNWAVGYSTSKDLKSWSDYKICFDENADSPGVESPFVVEWNNKYYLFLSARPWPAGGEDVFVSDTPYHWESGNQVKRFFPWHAAELVEDHDGQWYMTLSSGIQSNDLKIAPLNIQ